MPINDPHTISLALDQIRPGSVVGLGHSGVLADLALMLPKVKHRLQGVVGGSVDTAMELKAKGLKLIAIEDVDTIDVYFDCALEATSVRFLNKGGDPFLARAKVMADLAQSFVCFVNQTNLVARLGEQPFAVEVLPIARSLVGKKLIALGAGPSWEEGVMTENGNLILNAGVPGHMDPWELEAELDHIPGIVAHSIFTKRPADWLIIAGSSGAELLGPTNLKRNLV